MTGIYHDPTESRPGTRLPQAVIDQSVSLPGLERLTGADLLIAIDNPPDDVRVLADDDSCYDVVHLAWRGGTPQEIAKAIERPLPFILRTLQFKQSCRSGLLVQRKTGTDLTSSIPRLSEILLRMLNWTNRPWLLFVGDLKSAKNGNAVIDGREIGFSYNAVQGALESWQLRGIDGIGSGYYTILRDDSLVASWCARWLTKLPGLTEEKVVIKQVTQPIVGPSDDKSRKLTILSALKHVGREKAIRLLDQYGTLAGALEAVLDPGFPISEQKPRGFGAITTVENRQLFGLDEEWMRLVVEAKESE
jgi:hypothetical protein